jgi:hypothetical protein
MDSEPFLYTGQLSSIDIRNDTAHIRVDPSVKVIRPHAFWGFRQLRNIDLCEGLEIIDEGAFQCCESLMSINIPFTVKQIGKMAFHGCNQLTNVELNEGLERIDEGAFQRCSSLTSIRIPSTVKEIGRRAFQDCRQLRIVELLVGLECIIYDQAFEGCSSLERIRIPSAVTEIGEKAFMSCNNLVAIDFCEQIEQVVNVASLHWWNHGVSEVSLITYSFLSRRDIPARLDTIRAQNLKNNINNMLQRIPEEPHKERYFDTIDSRLANYEHLQEAAPLLELALWKAKIMEQSKGGLINNDTKILCRIDSIPMFAIIFPNVISFLVDE